MLLVPWISSLAYFSFCFAFHDLRYYRPISQWFLNLYSFPEKLFSVPIFISTFLLRSPFACPIGFNSTSPQNIRIQSPWTLPKKYYPLLELMYCYLLHTWVILDHSSSDFPHLISPPPQYNQCCLQNSSNHLSLKMDTNYLPLLSP